MWEYWGKNHNFKWWCSCCWEKPKCYYHCTQCLQYVCKKCKDTQEHQARSPFVSALDVRKHSIVCGADGWAELAYDLFCKDGFVVIHDVLTMSQCNAVRQDCERVAKEIVGPERGGNRGPGRYSFGIASGSGGMLHVKSFAQHLLGSACSKLCPMLDGIFEGGATPGFVCTGGGGDFVIGDTGSDQWIHADIELGKEHDVRMPPPMISINFAVQEVTASNGPMRIIPGTQLYRGIVQSPIPDSWLHSFLCPVPVGAALVRDARVLHSGTRNSTHSTRYLPSVEFVSTDFRTTNRRDCFPPLKSLPRELFDCLEPQTKQFCAEIVADRGRKVQPSYTMS